MKVLIVGSGGREHAIGKKLVLDNAKIYTVGPWRNPGLDRLGQYKVMDINNVKNVVEYAKENFIDIVIVGSENQLAQGLANALTEERIFCFGPTDDQARIETDKVFARSVIPDEYNPKYVVVERNVFNRQFLQELIAEFQGEYVVKAVGLCGGKGVSVSGIHLHNFAETFAVCQKLIDRDSRFLFEEKLVGPEFTLMSFTDGLACAHMPVVRDFKLLNDGNTGPNTGGMGCISYFGGSAPFLFDDDLTTAKEINEFIVSQIPGYTGVLYGSFMRTRHGIKVIEYNCRFGDPEAINVLQLLQTSLLEIIQKCRYQQLKYFNVDWSWLAMMTVYVTAPGYPEKPENAVIAFPRNSSTIYGKIQIENGQFMQLGSRSIAFCSSGRDLPACQEKINILTDRLQGECHFRTDFLNYV